MDIVLSAARLAALGNPARLRLYHILVRAGEAGLAMGQIQEVLEVPASTLTHHCRALLQVDLIQQQRAGTSLICRTNYPVMHGLIEDQLAECCAGTPETRDQRPG